jgi:HD-GYP domain-containing protein (c-di-GMP phosphodiesterase class II)
MADEQLRILLLGGDATVWVAISAALGQRGSQIIVPKEISSTDLAKAAESIDVILIVVKADDVDRTSALRVVKSADLHRMGLVLCQPDDEETIKAATDLGMAGCLSYGAPSEKLAAAVTQVAEGGAFYDPNAAVVIEYNRASTAENSNMSAARALASALELKDTYTGGHAERVMTLAMRLAKAAELHRIYPVDALEAAFLLHDVGKIGIPESILNKPGGLTDTERRVLQTHPILGERIVAPLKFPDCVRQVIRHHHEWWDGSGYPDGLSGETIPAPARIFSIADVVDAMTSLRPYRMPTTFEEAIEEIMRKAGTQFDPALATLAEEAFLEAPIDLVAPSVTLPQ